MVDVLLISNIGMVMGMIDHSGLNVKWMNTYSHWAHHNRIPYQSFSEGVGGINLMDSVFGTVPDRSDADSNIIPHSPK